MSYSLLSSMTIHRFRFFVLFVVLFVSKENVDVADIAAFNNDGFFTKDILGGEGLACFIGEEGGKGDAWFLGEFEMGLISKVADDSACERDGDDCSCGKKSFHLILSNNFI